jgi:hypothetical protein
MLTAEADFTQLISTLRARVAFEASLELARANGVRGRALAPLKRDIRKAKRASQTMAVDLYHSGASRAAIQAAVTEGLKR